MSLILDALNRSRQEAQQMPDLATLHYADAPDAGGDRSRVVLIVALLVALLLIAWLVWDRRGKPETGAVAPFAELPGPSVQAERPQPATAGLGEGAADPAPGPERQEVAGVARPQSATAPPPTPQPPTPQPTTPQPATPEPATPEPATPEPAAPSVGDLYQQQLNVEEDASAASESAAETTAVEETPAPASEPGQVAREEEVLDLEQLVDLARDEVANARLEEHEVPFLGSLSQQTKDSIPTIYYQRHDYSGTAGRSSVVINGKTLRAGAAAAGLKVEEILPDSIVLNYKGTRFRLRALNSWVNL